MHAVYYRDREGREPVKEYLEVLPPEMREEIVATVILLNRLGSHDPPLPFPFSSQVEGPLRELRCHYGRTLYRILYQRSGNLFILLHALGKRSARLADADKALAKERWSDFKTRMDAESRRPPRPVGHDAP
ncbi:MAG: type II toxin-antitoxin system RelE/ParE family toxin [Chloroflexota bacterium]